MRGRASFIGGTTALALVMAVQAPAAPGPHSKAGTGPAGVLLPTLSTLGPSERVETIPVERNRGRGATVVLSERLRANGGLRRGDIVRAVAEAQVTTTCVDGSERCIGRPYSHSPRADAWIVIARGPENTRGARISSTVTRRCTQQRPNRNHHCVLPIANASLKVRNVSNLPCRPSDCWVNMVVSADHPGAKPGEVVVMGADRPNGTVRPDKARIDAFVARGRVPPPVVFGRDRRISKRIPIEPAGDAGRRVARSIRVNGLRKGDVLRIDASQTVSISGLPYNTFIGSRMIVTSNPKSIKTSGYAAKSVALGGEVTELNGFNCTKGPSEYRNPCTSRKVAIAVIRKPLPNATAGRCPYSSTSSPPASRSWRRQTRATA